MGKYNRDLLPDYYYWYPELIRREHTGDYERITVFLEYAYAGGGLHPDGYKYDGKFIISYEDEDDVQTTMVTTTPYVSPVRHIYAEMPARGGRWRPCAGEEWERANKVFDDLVKRLGNNKLNEGGLSRIWQHTRDDNTFAIIGSQDKDTKEDRSEELIGEVSKLVRQRDNNIGYKPLWGRYEYEDGTIGEELSLIIFNISKKKALEIAKDINQESIIWKDAGFFGFLTPDGAEDGVFSYNPRNMNFSDEDIKLFGSRLAKHKNKNQLRWFKFVMEEYKPMGRRNAVRNMATRPKREREKIFSIENTFDD